MATVQNLIINAGAGFTAQPAPYSSMFRVPNGLRLFFYCSHDTNMVPDVTSPVPIMQGSLNAYEVITEGNPCFNYCLGNEEEYWQKVNWPGIGTGLHSWPDRHDVNNAILYADRKERLQTGEDLPEDIFDFLIPVPRVTLEKLLNDINRRYPHYRDIHCLFNRKKHAPETLRYVRGKLGDWELIELETYEKEHEGWVFIEINDAKGGRGA
ncbi:putative adhesin [Endozoicomonas euniceicola]|uniref:Putative adhesin Stv domain-containing protein n=1 Tax=Endozoicomonas euniceicola TaxID=1234143 RepID=A0ABY6GXI6_9GAMM|nr:hypothetical protein [Endozoicomonas euniceicola]UYM17482.1 hypothetical protein NX720_06065 [Endozoicomonas euniceicola]